MGWFVKNTIQVGTSHQPLHPDTINPDLKIPKIPPPNDQPSVKPNKRQRVGRSMANYVAIEPVLVIRAPCKSEPVPAAGRILSYSIDSMGLRGYSMPEEVLRWL